MKIVSVSGGRGLLPEPAAQSLMRLDKERGQLPTTELGRTEDRQLYLYNGWINRVPGFNRALHPSNPLANHVMIDGRRGAMDTEAVQIGFIGESTLNEHGWYRTAPDEYWHYEYFYEKDLHRFDGVIVTTGKDYGMEYYILREDGAVFHITPVQAYRFKSVNDYNSWRDIVKAGGVKTSLLVPPAITSLKKWPAWRVQAIADRMGVTLP